MNYQINPKLSLPAYMQLYQQLVKDIVDKVYPFNAKLPSKRLLASETGVSIITIEHALAILVDEGYIEPKQRSGYYVIYQEHDFNSTYLPANRKKSVKKNVDFAWENHFPYSILAKNMRKVMSENGPAIFEECESKGLYALRVQIQKYLLRSRGIHVDVNQIIIGSGTEYLYGLLGQLFSQKNIAIEDPSYEKIEKVYQNFSISIEKLSLKEDGIDYQDLKNSQADILHVTPFHSYPSQISISASKKKEYICWAQKNQRFLIEDNYDSELTVSSKQEDTLFQLSKEDNVIYLNTFSSTIAISVRVGYMLLPKQLLPMYEKKLGFYACTVPLFEQYLIAQLLENGDFERHLNRIRRAKRKLLIQK